MSARDSHSSKRKLKFRLITLRGRYIRRWRPFSPSRSYAQDDHERSPILAKGRNRICPQVRTRPKTLPRCRRSLGQGQGGGHKRRPFIVLRQSRYPLLMLASSPTASGFKVGSRSPPYLAFPVETFLEKSSTFSTRPLVIGSGSRSGGLGVPEASRTMDPTPSEFLSVFFSEL